MESTAVPSSAPAKPAPSKLQLYTQLARPFTLLPPLLGIVSGSICAFGSIHNPDPSRSLTASVVLTVILGSTLESVVGATIEKRGWLDNEAVNFLNTLIGALAAMALAPLVR